MKPKLLFIFICTDCFSWVLWEGDVKTKLGMQEVYWRVTPVKDEKGQGIRWERRGSGHDSDLTRSQLTQWRAREQTEDWKVLHGKEWQAPGSLPCLVLGWGYSGKVWPPLKS